MLKVEVKMLVAGRWQDKPWMPQFEVEKDEVIKVSPEMAHIMIEAGKAELVKGIKTPVPEPDAKKPEAYTLDGIGLAAAMVKKLQENGLTTVPQLIEKTAAEILEFDGVGQAKVDDVQAALEKIGFSLKVEGEK